MIRFSCTRVYIVNFCKILSRETENVISEYYKSKGLFMSTVKL